MIDPAHYMTHDHFFGTFPGAHDESCLDHKFDHTACTGENHLHHPIPNHNHPRNNLAKLPLLARRHHSLSTMPHMPNFFDTKGQSPVGFGMHAVMSPNVPVDFPSMINADSSPQGEDDSTSAACSSDCNQCPSDCGASEAGDVCRDAECGPACDDVQCERAASPCTDVECLTRSMSDKDKAAADVLASFGEDPLGQGQMASSSMSSLPSSQLFSNQGSYHNGGMPAAMAQSLNMGNPFHCAPDSYSNNFMDPNMGLGNLDWMAFGTHFLQEHSSGGCVRPCLIDNQNLPFDKCPLPHHAHTHPGQQSFCLPDNSDPSHLVACGVEFNSPTAWFEHLQEQHLYQQGEHLGFLSATHQSQTSVMASHERQPLTHPQSPDTILVSTDVLRGRESSTASSISRPLSASSQPETPNTAATEASTIKTEQFACKWHKEDDGQVCGMTFLNDEELQTHCREQHLKTLCKTEKGFECRWEECARKENFTQKSKLERHLQTHTGCKLNFSIFAAKGCFLTHCLVKPVKCTICGLALSAKQSLAQHMRIHTGEKPWSCQHPGCDAAFKQQSALSE